MIPVGILTAAATSSLIGLLDLYPGAIVAFSLRKLRNAYSGSAIRVRRSTDSAEINIGFTSLGDLDTTTLLSFVGAGSGFISVWYDQSGNVNNATAINNANQFTIVASGVLITKNSKPSTRIFSTEFMNLSNTITGTAGTMINLSATVSDPPTLPNGAPFGRSTSSNEASHQPFTDGVIYENFASTTRKTLGNPTNNTTNLYLYNAISDVNLYNVKINNTTFFNTTTNTVGFGSAVPYIGRTSSVTFGEFNFIGFITEIVIYNNNQNSNISGINSNINTYYTIY